MPLFYKHLKYFFVLICSYLAASYIEASPRLQRDGPVARDYVNKLEWMRCSVGQIWENDTCVGEVLLLSVREALEIEERLRNLDGGGWRLPNLKELRSILTKVENRPKDILPNVDTDTFPNTFAGSYWTSDVSFYSKQYQWSLNFLTGQRYNRFFPSQKLAVRMVRNYSASKSNKLSISD